MLKLIERYKLDDICRHVLFIGIRVKCFVVCIKNFHSFEICFTYSHDNDGDWQRRASNNLVNSLLHIVNDSICQNAQDGILLVHLVDLSCLHLIVCFTKNLIEVGWSIKIYSRKGALIMADHFINPVYSWVKDIAIQGKAVGATLIVRVDCPAKAIKVDQLVTVIVLKDISYSPNGFHVLITSRVKVMKRASLSRITVRQSEVNGECQIYFTAAKNVLEERVLSLDFQI